MMLISALAAVPVLELGLKPVGGEVSLSVSKKSIWAMGQLISDSENY
jgi:hypothetical protein